MYQEENTPKRRHIFTFSENAKNVDFFFQFWAYFLKYFQKF